MLTSNRGVIFPHYPTRWAWNIFSKERGRWFVTVSPSHTVGLELFLLLSLPWMFLRHHPTQWAWNNAYFELDEYFKPRSPSHTVGLEQKHGHWKKFWSFCSVTIPRGGLKTVRNKSLIYGVRLYVAIPRSGLRTVAIKLATGDKLMSPSHTVGLERKEGEDITAGGLVSIPHSGLGTTDI